MSISDVERLAILETEMQAVKNDTAEIKRSLKALEAIASKGGGAFNAILMLGGLIGWMVGVVAGIYTMTHH